MYLSYFATDESPAVGVEMKGRRTVIPRPLFPPLARTFLQQPATVEMNADLP